jgi:hypothetical protein
MPNLKIKALILSMSIILSFSSFSQTEEGTTIVTQDLETWYKVGLKYEAHEKFTIGLHQGFRFNTNSTLLDQVLTNLNFKYKATTYLKFGLGLRYI